MSKDDIDKFYDKHVKVIDVDIGLIEHVNPVVDLFTDVGMMELDRYEKGDYKGEIPPDLVNNVTRLLNLSLDGIITLKGEILEKLTGKTLSGVLKQMFMGEVYLLIKRIDWESIRERVKAEEAVLKAL